MSKGETVLQEGSFMGLPCRIDETPTRCNYSFGEKNNYVYCKIYDAVDKDDGILYVAYNPNQSHLIIHVGDCSIELAPHSRVGSFGVGEFPLSVIHEDVEKRKDSMKKLEKILEKQG